MGYSSCLTFCFAIVIAAVAVVALVHGDVHDKETVQALNYIFHCHLTVRKAQGRNVCSGVLRKGSGKLVDSVGFVIIIIIFNFDFPKNLCV